MKSDIIRKRSCHDAHRMGGGTDTPSASPGVSRRATPSRELSPTFAPDSTTQMTYEYNDEGEYRSSQSELMGALGQDSQQHHHSHSYSSSFLSSHFPGPYHPDYLTQYYNPAAEALPFAEESDVDGSDLNNSQDSETRINKRRRMSVDSASEPPSSAASYGSYNTDGYSSSTTSHSHRSSTLLRTTLVLTTTINSSTLTTKSKSKPKLHHRNPQLPSPVSLSTISTITF